MFSSFPPPPLLPLPFLFHPINIFFLTLPVSPFNIWLISGCDQIPDKNQFKGGKLCFGSQLRGHVPVMLTVRQQVLSHIWAECESNRCWCSSGFPPYIQSIDWCCPQSKWVLPQKVLSGNTVTAMLRGASPGRSQT